MLTGSAATAKVVAPRDIRVSGRRVILGRVSRETGISRSHLSKIFNGLRNPSLRAAARIAQYLGITVDELYREIQARGGA